VPIALTGPLCRRRDCRRPEWKDGLCNRCWRLARLFGKDPLMFAYQPLGGYTDQRDADQLPWEEWERQARARGMAIADLLAQAPPPDATPPGRRE
jgi:hypothetical protein